MLEFWGFLPQTRHLSPCVCPSQVKTSRPCIHTPTPDIQGLPRPCLRACGDKWLKTIQATALPSSCGSIQTFAEALRIFLSGRGSPRMGSAARLVSEHPEWTSWAAQGAGGEVRRAQPMEASSLSTPPLPSSPPGSGTEFWRGQFLIFSQAEMPAQRAGSLPTRPSPLPPPHCSVGLGGNDRV